MAMSVSLDNPALVGQNTGKPLGSGGGLDTAVIVAELQKLDPMFHADMGARLNIVHPYMDQRQGLFYGAKHICSMDRGISPQWPEWTVALEAVDVPLDYALLHDDLPVLNITDMHEGFINPAAMASVERPCLDDVKKIGWAEVFYILVKRKYATKSWLASTFKVPMDWLDTVEASPVALSYATAQEKGWAV